MDNKKRRELLENYTAHGKCPKSSTVSGKHYRFSVLTEQLLRLEYSRDGVFEDRPSQVVLNREFPTPEFSVKESETSLEISTSAFHLVYNKGEFSPANLYIDAKNRYTNYGGRWKYGATTYGNPARHHNLYGTTRTLDKIDGDYPLELGLQDTSGRSFFDDSASLVFDESGEPRVRREGNTDVYFLCHNRDYLGALADFYRLTGAPPMLPRYALGNWWSRYWKYTDREYLALTERFRENGMPFSVAVVDMDWHITEVAPEYGRGWTGYTWNRELFPEPDKFLGELKSKGYHSALNLHPADGVQAFEEAYPDMAREMGIDPESRDPVNFDAASGEFWRAYFKHLIHPNEKLGVDFWWIDWQQGTESRLPGLDPLWALNHYHYIDNCRDDHRGMVLSRYAGLGSHRYPFGFSGDTIATWKSLDFQPYFTANAVNVGYGCWSHDIGGFKTGVRDRELFLRWIQFGVFSPVMRLHSSNNPFCSKEPWSYGEQTAKLTGELLRLRHRLIPYIYSSNHRASSELIPTVLPLYYRYPEKKEAYEFKNEYFFGDQLIVCPITSPTSNSTGLAGVKAWIPKGIWTDIFTGRSYHGCRVMTLCRDISRPPVLAKPGAILPMAADLGGDNSVANPERLDVYLFPGDNGEFKLYEDSGDGYAYESGEFVETVFEFEYGERSRLSVKLEGDTSLLPEKRSYALHFRGFEKGIEARGDGIVSQSYDSETNTLTVELTEKARGEGFELELVGCRVEENRNYAKNAFDFLMQAQLPVELKTNIYKLYKRKYDKLELAVALNSMKLEDELADALFELTFS